MKSKPHNWKKSDCAQLIKAYSKYPVLYNKAHPNYTSQKEREIALMNIVAALQECRPGTVVQEVKSRIANLRTQYLRERNRIQEAIDRGEEPVVKMWCYIDLQFLEDETKLDDPLETANLGNTTWYPDIDDDSFSESSNTREIDDDVKSSAGDLLENMDQEQSDELQFLALDAIPTSFVASNSDETTTKWPQTSKRKNQSPIRVTKNANSLDKIHSFTNTSDEPPTKQSVHTHQTSIDDIDSKLNNLNQKTAKVKKLTCNLPMEEKPHNRAFVENLLYDLDGLSDEVQQRVKWLITNEVYAAFYNLKK